MVAHQVDDPLHRHRRAAAEPVHHLRAVEAAIHVIAQMHQHRLIHRAGREVLGDLLMHRGQTIQAPMDVADGINALARRQGRRGGGEIDHETAT